MDERVGPSPLAAEHLSLVLDSLKAGVYVIDQAGRCIFANAAALATLGLGGDELIGRDAHRLFHRPLAGGAPRDAADCPTCRSVAAGAPRETDDELVGKGGEVLPVRCTATPLLAAGNRTGAVVVFWPRAPLAEEAAAAKIFQEVFEACADAVLILDGDRFVECNEAAVRMLRCRTRAEVRSLSPWEMSPEHQPDGRSSRDKALEMIARAYDNRFHRFDWVHTRADGEALPVEVSLTAVELVGRTVLHVVWKERTGERPTAPATLASQLRLTDIVDVLPDATFIIDGNGTVAAWNSAMEVMTGVPAQDMIGNGDYAYAVPFYGYQRPMLIDLALRFDDAVAKLYQTFTRRGDIVFGESYTPNLPAGNVYLFSTASVLRNARGEAIGAIESLRDITRRRRMEEALREAEIRFRTLFETSRDAMMTLAPPSWRFTSGNPAALELFGVRDAEEFTALGPWDVSPDRQPDGQPSTVRAREMIELAMREGSHFFEWTHQRVGGRAFAATVLLTRVEILGQGMLQATVRDITEQKRAQEEIQRLAHFDSLTGLPNRALLTDRVEQAIAAAKRRGAPLALMFLDLDHFKDINDALGHRVGDRLLVRLAERLRQSVRSQDTVARLGGDEFILLLPDTDTAAAEHLARRLLRRVAEPYRMDGHTLVATPSIGIAVYPEDGEDFGSLSRLADAAMYSVKRGGRNGFRFYQALQQI